MSKTRYSRRNILKTGAAVMAATALPAPMIWAQDIKGDHGHHPVDPVRGACDCRHAGRSVGGRRTSGGPRD